MALIIAFLAVFAVGNISGGVIMHWKNGAQIAIITSEKQALESQNDILTAANQECANNVVAVQSGVKDVTDALDGKKQAAATAMKGVQYWAAQYDRLAREVNGLPIRPDETQCQAVEREQKEYLEKRHAAK
jgi:hypothetical protein